MEDLDDPPRDVSSGWFYPRTEMPRRFVLSSGVKRSVEVESPSRHGPGTRIPSGDGSGMSRGHNPKVREPRRSSGRRNFRSTSIGTGDRGAPCRVWFGPEWFRCGPHRFFTSRSHNFVYASPRTIHSVTTHPVTSGRQRSPGSKRIKVTEIVIEDRRQLCRLIRGRNRQ